jgi:diguanylate cyclase
VNGTQTEDKVRELSGLALAFLTAHGISAEPRAYTLAYIYHADTHPKIKAEIDSLLGAGGFNRHACVRIYEEAFGLDAEARAIRDASMVIERTLGQVLETLQVAGDDAKDFGKVLEDFSGKVGIESLPGAGDLRGALEMIVSETRKMEMRSTELEPRFANTSDEIVELRRNLDEMRLVATTDGLTGVANRKHFDTRLSEFADECAATGEPLALLMGDVDHFKKFNDDYGHTVGDMVLRLVARTLSECGRGRDFVARYGGEEFVVLLPKTGLKGAFAVAENIRSTIASKCLARKKTGESLGMVTLSFGVAQYKPGESLDDFITRADSGLYQAKNRGRNRVESAEPLATELRRVGFGS